MGWWDDVQKAVTGAGGSGTGTLPPPPSLSGGSSGTTYQQYTAPAGPQGGALPAGTVYTVGSNGALSIDYRPPASSGGGAVSVSLNPNSTSAWSIREMPDGSIARINELTGAIETIVPAPQYSATNDRDRDGYDDSTGLPNGVVRVNTDISPTGLVYKGQPVNPDGSLYSGASGSGVGDYTSLKEGPGGIWGLNRKTGTFELIPGSGAFGSTATNQPATYSGGGGGGAASAYSSIATAQINAQSRLAAIEAEAAAGQARDAAQAALQKELLALQQNFQREQSAAQNALTAMGMQQQFAIADAQLRQQYEQNKVNLIGQYRDALRDYDPRAVLQQIRDYGSLSSAMNENPSGFLTDNANAGAAALLAGLRRPYEGPQPPNLGQFTGGAPMTGGLPGGGGVTTGAGGTTGTGGTSVSGGSGGATGALPGGGGVDLTEIERSLRASGLPEAEVAAAMREMQQGQAAVSEAQLSAIYQQLTGQGQYLTHDAMGNPTIAGYGTGGMHTLQQQSDPWFSGVWQTSDPYAPNYKSPNDPMFLPSWAKPTSASGMAGTGGNFVPPTEPIPTSHPLAGGLSGGLVKPPDTVIPMLAGGGMAKGAFITGDSLSGRPTGHEELVIAPGGAQVIPLGKMGAQQLMGRLPRFASGTPSYLQGMDWWSLSQAAQEQPVYEAPKVAVKQPTYTAPQPTYTPPVIPYSQPVQQPIPVVGSAPTVPTSTQAPVSSSPAPPSPAPTATNPLATPSPTQAAPPAPPTESNPAATGVEGLTAEEQALLAEIMATRTGTENMGMNPYDVAWGAQAPFFQDLFYRNEAQRLGVPEELYRQDVARNRLAGVGGGLQGALRY